MPMRYAYNVNDTELRIPGSVSGSLFGTAIPFLNYRYESWGHTGLERSQKESCSHQAAEVIASSHAAKNTTPVRISQQTHRTRARQAVSLPAENHSCDKLASRQFDKKVCDDRLPDQLGDVDDGAEPAVFIAD